MSKAEKSNITSETEQPNRRTAMLLGALAAASISTPAAAALAIQPTPRSAEYLECLAAHQIWMDAEKHAAENDEFCDGQMEAFDNSVEHFLAATESRATTRGQQIDRIGEIAALLRISWWEGDRKTGEATDPFIERALWLAIEKLTGIVPPTVVEATLFNGSQDPGLIDAPTSA